MSKSKYDCITVCVVSISLAILLSVIIVLAVAKTSIDGLTEVLSDPGSPTRIEMEHITITGPDGVSFDIDGFDATANSRLIDILTGLAISEGGQ